MKDLRISKAKSENIMLFLVVVLSFFRFSYFGFSYTPYLDDYTQYLYYPSFENPWEKILLKGAGLRSTRPLAGLFDFFLWSRFGQNLGVVVFVMSILYGASGVLFFKAFKDLGINLGPIFFAIYLFLPLNAEGTYWISASSRIGVSLFLASIAMWAVAKDKTLLFCVFSFLSVWFYEQTAVVSVSLGALTAILKKSPKILVFVTVVFLSLLVFYFRFGSLGENADRLKITAPGEVLKAGLSVLAALADIMGRINFLIIFKGFIRGFKIIALDFSFLWISLLLTFCVLFVNFSAVGEETKKQTKKQLLIGAALIFGSLLPFVLAKASFLNLRNMVPLLLGLGIILDFITKKVFKKYSAVVAGVLIFCFSVSAVSEVSDYNYTAAMDKKAALEIANMIGPGTKTIKVKITSPPYYPQNAPFGDHIISFTASDWGPSGIVRTISKNKDVVVDIIDE